MKLFQAAVRVAIIALMLGGSASLSGQTPRETILSAIVADNDRTKAALIITLAGESDAVIPELFDAWKADELFIFNAPEGEKIPVRIAGGADAFGTAAATALRVADESPLLDASGAMIVPTKDNMERVRHNNRLRRAMKEVLDLIDLGAPESAKRLQAVQTIGFSRDLEKLPILEARLPRETDAGVSRAIRQSIAMLQLGAAERDVRLAALQQLEEMHTLSSYDAIAAVQSEAEKAGDKELKAAATAAMRAIDQHRSMVDFVR